MKSMYKNLKKEDWETVLNGCCIVINSVIPGSVADCYTTWQSELDDVNIRFSEIEEEAKQLSNESSFITERRDKLKFFYDELMLVDELSKKVGNQFDVLLDQIENISESTRIASEAIDVLFAMVMDFYIQIDLIKVKYDELMNCINCLKNPGLVSGQGIMKFIEDYGKKVDAVIATRDELVKLVIQSLSASNRIYKNISYHYGLKPIVKEWIGFLTDNVSENKSHGNQSQLEKAETESKKSGSADDNKSNCLSSDIVCDEDISLQFPLCRSQYFKDVKGKYARNKIQAEEISGCLLEANKKKESMLARKQSLEAAIKEVDPKNRS